MKFRPHDYQEYAISKLLDMKNAGLFLDMGLGKTVITLTAIDRLINEEFAVSRVLVIAPKRVAEDTWTTEAGKWDHLARLKISRVIGTAKQRAEALQQDADVYVINRENVVWLVDLLKKWPFDMVVVDELSSFKSSQAQRFKALRTFHVAPASLHLASSFSISALDLPPSNNRSSSSSDLPFVSGMKQEVTK